MTQVTTKTLHKIVAQSFKKHNLPKPRSKTRIIASYQRFHYNNYNDLRVVEFSIPLTEGLNSVLDEIKVMLTLYGHEGIIREYTNPFTRKTRFDVYARIK
jgi:hypothetical protein